MKVVYAREQKRKAVAVCRKTKSYATTIGQLGCLRHLRVADPDAFVATAAGFPSCGRDFSARQFLKIISCHRRASGIEY